MVGPLTRLPEADHDAHVVRAIVLVRDVRSVDVVLARDGDADPIGAPALEFVLELPVEVLEVVHVTHQEQQMTP